MKNQNVHDERVIEQRRKINSEVGGILMIALLLSVLVQQNLLNAPFRQYAVEIICFFGMSVYILIRYMIQGLDLYGEKRRAKYVPNIGLFVAVLAITFISAFGSSYVVMSYFRYLNKKRQAKIQEQFDEDEQDI